MREREGKEKGLCTRTLKLFAGMGCLSATQESAGSGAVLAASLPPRMVGRGRSSFAETQKRTYIRGWDRAGDLHGSELFLGPHIFFFIIFLIIWKVGGGTKSI